MTQYNEHYEIDFAQGLTTVMSDDERLPVMLPKRVINLADTPSEDIRTAMKAVRQETNDAYGYLPTGEMIGDFANRYAVLKYSRRVEMGREFARQKRQKKRKARHAEKNNTAHKKLHAVLATGKSV